MNIWELLGIRPTEDISKIKSAYARQAKQCHPEEHPEEFKALQNAYKLAVQIAKGRKAGITITYAPPTPTALPKPEEGQPSQGTESGKDRTEPERVPDEGQRQKKATAGTDQAQPETERVFDFSGVDAYGERGNFIRKFLLLAKNPYLQNNLEAWDYFLNQSAYAGLFSNTDFRREWVEAICSLKGWRRKTMVYFERFLSKFHTEEDLPGDGRWETQVRAFQMKKLPRPRLPAFCMDRFWMKEGRGFHRQLRAKISKAVGREIDLDVRADLVRYMKLYLSFGETEEAYIDRLHRGWRFEQALIFGAAVAVFFFVVMVEASSIELRREKVSLESYLSELYGPDLVPQTEEEQGVLQREYKAYWRYADDAMDEVLERYEGWEGQ